MSTFGQIFRVSTWGESHGLSVGCIIDNCPPGIRLNEEDIQPQLNRRRPGQSAISTPRDEKDRVSIQSGTEFGVTLGTPIALLVKNEDQRPKDYGDNTIDKFPRPSHADYTYQMKYGIKASSGGGRSSARETLARVAAGAVADKFLSSLNVEIVAFVSSVGHISLFDPTDAYPAVTTSPEFLSLIENITRTEVDQHLPLRCPSESKGAEMQNLVEQCRDDHDSIGGTVTCVIRNPPVGLGEPCFDKFEAMLAHAMLSIPATKGFEIGSGFDGTKMRGSKHNDPFVVAPPKEDAQANNTSGRPHLSMKTNNSGGIQGGITNAAPIYFRVAFKPPATIGQAQNTAGYDGVDGVLEAKGRHDPLVVQRAVPIVEAMAALVLADAVMMQAPRIEAKARIEAQRVETNGHTS